MTHPGPPDVSKVAFRIVQEATAEPPESVADLTPHGHAGDRAHAAAMTAEERLPPS